MPPWSYIVTALVLCALLVLSFPLTLGFSIIAFYWLFQAAAWLLAAVGLARVSRNLPTPLWVIVALETPLVVKGVEQLVDLRPITPAVVFALRLSSSLALSASAMGAIFLAGSLADRRRLAALTCALLAIHAAILAIPYALYFIGSSPLRFKAIGAVLSATDLLFFTIILGGFATAALLLAIRRELEAWIPVAICSVCLFQEVSRIQQGGRLPSELSMWLTPVFFLIGGAAIFRAGSMLAAYKRTARV